MNTDNPLSSLNSSGGTGTSSTSDFVRLMSSRTKGKLFNCRKNLTIFLMIILLLRNDLFSCYNRCRCLDIYGSNLSFSISTPSLFAHSLVMQPTLISLIPFTKIRNQSTQNHIKKNRCYKFHHTIISSSLLSRIDKDEQIPQKISIDTFSNSDTSYPSVNQPVLMEVDARHDTRIPLVYDPNIERYVEYIPSNNENHDTNGINRINGSSNGSISKLNEKITKMFKNSFLPEGVTESYYRYVKWRFLQRFINANVHVFGTQSLLLGLGKQNKRFSPSGASALGLSAVLNWVLKDALGKIVRMVWASKMGRKFDPDAKRWRYRSSLLFALGNGLEVMTYVYPSLFLLLATMANACKQMGMLTSSATRNALYNSFRDGSRENIGDITAKGEAQIAIVDLIGIASGVCLSRFIGTSVKAVFSVWVLLQVMEVFCVYKEIRSVVFRMLNFERLWIVVNKFLDIFNEQDFVNGSAMDIMLPTPDILAKDERIFMPPNHLARRGISFGSLSRAKLSPDELSVLIDTFQNDKYILVVGQDLKNKRTKWKWPGQKKEVQNSIEDQLELEAKANCHIVLHVDANNADIVKSTLALSILRRKLAARLPLDKSSSIINGDRQQQIHVNGGDDYMDEEKLFEFVRTQRSRDCIDIIRESKAEADKLFATFLKVLSAKGWATPSRFMFGRVSMRTEWPIKR